METLGSRIKTLRERSNISQIELSKKLDISNVQLSRYESDERRPDYETLKKISDFFEVTIDYLITGNNRATSSDEMWKELLDPNTQIFFKDLLEAPEEKIEELKKFWEIIKDRDKK